jgi:hypothetical protein
VDGSGEPVISGEQSMEGEPETQEREQGPAVVVRTTQEVVRETPSIFAEVPGGGPKNLRAGRNPEIDQALSYALEAADPYEKEGFTLRQDYWGGQLPVKQQKAIVHQLYKGNEYWFWMGTAQERARVAVHVYDAMGRLAEMEAWQKPHKAGARVRASSTGTYYLIVEVESSPVPETAWAMAYGYR